MNKRTYTVTITRYRAGGEGIARLDDGRDIGRYVLAKSLATLRVEKIFPKELDEFVATKKVAAKKGE